MDVGVNLDGVLITVRVPPTETVQRAIYTALDSIFPSGSIPAVDQCTVSLDGEKAELNQEVGSLAALREGRSLDVTLPF